MLVKPHTKIIVDSRGIKREVYVQGDVDWRKKEAKEKKKHDLEQYTKEDFLRDGFC